MIVAFRMPIAMALVLLSQYSLAHSLYCSSERPTAWPRERVAVRVWPDDPTWAAHRVRWTVDAGHLQIEGDLAVWDRSDVPAGSHVATARIEGEGGVACSVRLVVIDRSGERGSGRSTGRALLSPDIVEQEGYGLYSYLLIRPAADETASERNTRALDACLRLIPDVLALERYVTDRQELNSTYVPVRQAAPSPISFDWVQSHYDYDRATALLRAVSGADGAGPFLVSSRGPIGSPRTPSERIWYRTSLVFRRNSSRHGCGNSSTRRPGRTMRNQATGEFLVLRMRTTIAVLAEGVPQICNALGELISLRTSLAAGAVRK